jgi:LysM repeat protein
MSSVSKRSGWYGVGLLCLCLSLAGGWNRPAGAADQYEIYTVQAGDTLESIAQRYRTTVEKVREQNALAAEVQIKTGDQLIVPALPTQNDKNVAGRLVVSQAYTVKSGDTLAKIADAFRVPVESIKSKNGLKDDQSLQPGQMLMIPVREHVLKLSAPTPPPVETTTSSTETTLMRGVNLPSRGTPLPRFSNGASNPTSAPPTVKTSTPQLQTVGRLGTIVQSGGKIRRTKSANAASLYTCPVGMQLVITGQSDDWFAVMMSDRSTGWIPKKYVRLEDVELIAQPSAAYAGGGGGNYPVIEEAYRYLGVPFRYGGTTTNGMDCSAFVQRCFRAVGVSLPRTAAEQFNVGTPIPSEQLVPGDRVYFANSSGRINHTGIYIGNSQFIHASGAAGQVTVSNLFSGKYANIFAGARR